MATVALNLFLAIVPFLFGYFINYLQKKERAFKYGHKAYYAFIAFFMWLIFVPNTAYLITDMRHITGFCPSNYYDVCIENSWMILFFFSYSVIGWVLFVYAINQMRGALFKTKNNFCARYFAAAIIPIITLGVMMGLIDRYNSWNLFLSPLFFLHDGLKYFAEGIYFKNYIIITFFLYILYFSGNYLFKNKNNLNFKS